MGTPATLPPITTTIAPSTTANSQGAGAGNGIYFTPFTTPAESQTVLTSAINYTPWIVGGAVLIAVAYLYFRRH